MKKVLLPIVLLFFVITICYAAQIDGTWKGYIEGQYNIMVTLKSEGNKLTGTLAIVDNNPKSENPADNQYSPYVAAQLGKNEIKDGKIDGDNISFTCLFNETPILYKGVVQGDKILLTATFNSQNVKTTLSRVK